MNGRLMMGHDPKRVCHTAAIHMNKVTGVEITRKEEKRVFIFHHISQSVNNEDTTPLFSIDEFLPKGPLMG